MPLTRDNLPSIGFVSTYPPTSCGLATFTSALRESIAGSRGSVNGLGVVSLVDTPSDTTPPEVIHQHVRGDSTSMSRAAELLNQHDAVLIQHEYGIYGGLDGSEALELVSMLEVPSITTLHTVLGNPTEGQQLMLEAVVDRSDQAIVMSDTGFRRLRDRYDIEPEKGRVIPHGARVSLSGPRLDREERPVVLTWGLIGPGKGLETAIDAFADLTDLRPLPRYRILGRTHPKVHEAQGEAYMDGLVERVRSLGLEDVVEFDRRYLDTHTLTMAIRQADMVLLPYESTEQVTSGVLVEAIAAGKPVVATAFPHAVELLEGGAGAIVPHSDSLALAGALRSLLTDPAAAHRMSRLAGAIGSTFLWPVVAREYERVIAALVKPSRFAASPAASSSNDGLARVG
jgi:glycosyltransferase involved in cell wall biosynthesis